MQVIVDLICFDKECISFFSILLKIMDLDFILGKGKDFKVKWIAQIVQFFFFLQLEKKEVLRQHNNFLSTFLLV